MFRGMLLPPLQTDLRIEIFSRAVVEDLVAWWTRGHSIRVPQIPIAFLAIHRNLLARFPCIEQASSSMR